MMRTLFPNCQTVLQVGAQDYVFVLQQDKYTSVRSILSDTIEAVEYDFGLRLSIMLGQVWSQTGPQALSDLIKAGEICLRLGGVRVTKVYTPFHNSIYGYGRKTSGPEGNQGMPAPDDLGSRPDSEIILSLWENSAVLTKTAQQLYLHRNSLNTRLIDGKN